MDEKAKIHTRWFRIHCS